SRIAIKHAATELFIFASTPRKCPTNFSLSRVPECSPWRSQRQTSFCRTARQQAGDRWRLSISDKGKRLQGQDQRQWFGAWQAGCGRSTAQRRKQRALHVRAQIFLAASRRCVVNFRSSLARPHG